MGPSSALSALRFQTQHTTSDSAPMAPLKFEGEACTWIFLFVGELLASADTEDTASGIFLEKY